MRLLYIISIFSIALSGCEQDNESDHIPPPLTGLAGTYQSSGYLYHSLVPRAFAMNKTALAGTPNTIYVDLADLAVQGFKVALFVDPITYKTYVSIAPGAIGPSYVLYPQLPAPFTPKWNNSPFCNNTYDPDRKIFYLRIGWSAGASGNIVVEEMLVKQ